MKFITKIIMTCLLVLFSMSTFAHTQCKTEKGDLIFLVKNTNVEGFTVTINWEAEEIPAVVKFENSLRHIISIEKDKLKVTYSVSTGLGTGKVNDELVMVECIKN